MGIKYFKRAILNKKREEKTWTWRRHLHPKDYFTNDAFRPIFIAQFIIFSTLDFAFKYIRVERASDFLNTHMLVQFCYPIFLFNLSIQQKSLSKFIANILLGNVCGSIGTAVASKVRGPRFDSSHQQNLY